MQKFANIQSVIFYAFCASAFAVTINGNTIDGFWEKFALPYRDAIQTLAYHTLKPLADAAVPSEMEEADQLLRNTTASLHYFYDTLRPMQNMSEKLRQQQEKDIVAKTLDLGRLENVLQQTENRIASATTELQQKEQALNSAVVQLNQEQASLQRAQNVLNVEKRKLKRKKLCWIFPPACLFVGMDSARAKVRSAQAIVATNQRRVANAQVSLNTVRNRVSQLQQTKAQQNAQKQILVKQISDMRIKLSLLSNIKEKISGVVVYLSGIFGAGQSLQSIARKMVDIAAVLEPLQAIASLVGTFAGLTSAELQASLTSIRQSMIVLNTKLPQYPLDDRVI